MTDPKSEIMSRRLKILGKEEIRNIFELPDLTMEERLEYFSLQIPSAKFPTRFIPEKYKRYLYRKNKGAKGKQLIPDRYEFLVYRLLRDGLESGEMHCPDSLRFRSFEDDLLDDAQWQNKESLLDHANLPILKAPITIHLKNLEELLEQRLEEVNRRILAEENKHFVLKG